MRVLITGKGSYVGGNLKKWLENPGGIIVDELDLIDAKWKEYDFTQYDAVIHVAAIVHKKHKKITWEDYRRVNIDLTVEVARKAKENQVKHFIFFSTMAVYGQNKKLPYGNVIDDNTPLNPKNYYGRSKLEAEKKLKKLNSKDFIISIVRPPNIYGYGCPGNYMNHFIKMVKILPVFPKVYEESKQSFLYIDNLCKYIEILISDRRAGVFHPQDGTGFSTCQLVSEIANAIGKKIYFSAPLGTVARVFSKFKIVIKIFGGLSYNPGLSEYPYKNYTVVDFSSGIKKTIV